MHVNPTNARELAEALASARKQAQSIEVVGGGSKLAMGGPRYTAEHTISTGKLDKILQYEPRDLTISVEAGVRFADLSALLASKRQMLPLDPPFASEATVGGVIATNGSGPRRRLFGTARDMVIGMSFATLEGKLVETGGMVVKNVAGLDMGKLLIGSFGTLAVVASVNFKVTPQPEETRTFRQRFSAISDAIAARDRILAGHLQPYALDLLKLEEHYELCVQAGGTPALLRRYSEELRGAEILTGSDETALWDSIREFTPRMLAGNAGITVVRIGCALNTVGAMLEQLPAPALARAGNGVCYAYFADANEAVGRGVIEFAPDGMRATDQLWPVPGSGFAMMKEIKRMFDPQALLNRGRLYGRI